MTNTKQWNILLADQRSRRKLSAGSSMRGIENKKWECYAASKTRAKNLLEDGGDGTGLEQMLDRGVAVQKRIGFVAGKRQSASARPMVRRAIRAGRADDWSEL